MSKECDHVWHRNKLEPRCPICGQWCESAQSEENLGTCDRTTGAHVGLHYQIGRHFESAFACVNFRESAHPSPHAATCKSMSDAPIPGCDCGADAQPEAGAPCTSADECMPGAYAKGAPLTTREVAERCYELADGEHALERITQEIESFARSVREQTSQRIEDLKTEIVRLNSEIAKLTAEKQTILKQWQDDADTLKELGEEVVKLTAERDSLRESDYALHRIANFLGNPKLEAGSQSSIENQLATLILERVKRAEAALRDVRDKLTGALRNGDWQRVKEADALLALKGERRETKEDGK